MYGEKIRCIAKREGERRGREGGREGGSVGVKDLLIPEKAQFILLPI